MKGYIRSQSVIFGDFSNYRIDSKSIYDLMGKLKNYEVIPNVIDEIQIDIKDSMPVQKNVKRVQLNSIKDKLNINILQNNIVINAMPNIDIKSESTFIDIEKFIKDTKDIFAILLEIINVKANRVSLITTYLDDSDLIKQYEKYNKPGDFFKEKDVFEWNIRRVVRENISILSNEEINIVYNIIRANGIISSNIPTPINTSYDGVLKEIDINTIPENANFRMDSKFIDSFYDIALSKKSEIERMDEDEK